MILSVVQVPDMHKACPCASSCIAVLQSMLVMRLLVFIIILQYQNSDRLSDNVRLVQTEHTRKCEHDETGTSEF